MSNSPSVEPSSTTSTSSAAWIEVSLSDFRVGECGQLVSVDGSRVFRRRLLELGLVPGTEVSLVNVAPLGDPLELEVRGCRLSIRRAQARALRLKVQRGTRRLQVVQ